MPSRRDMLTSAAGAALASFLASRRSVAQAIADLAREPCTLGRALRELYDLDPAVTYLNHASIGTTPRVVRERRAELDVFVEANPWRSIWDGAVDDEVETARAEAARVINADPDELAIVRTTTEAMHFLASGLPLGPGGSGPADEVLFSSLNHIGAGACFRHWSERMGYAVRSFDFPAIDAPDLTPGDIVEIYTSQIRPETRLLVFPHVDNFLGLRHPARELVAAARARGVEWIAIDAAQTVGMLPVDVRAIDADFLATSAHKYLQAPKGLGLLHLRKQSLDQVRPMFVTWGQSRWQGTARAFEDYGTRDPAPIIAMGDAAAFQRSLDLDRTTAHRMALRESCRQRVDATPGLRWASPRHADLASAVALIHLENADANDTAARLFEEHGIVVRPMRQDGLNALRLSFNAANDGDELERFFRALDA